MLMRPSLPSSLFDLIVAPEHDVVATGQNVVEVKGVLNGVPFVDNKDTNAGLMLIAPEGVPHGIRNTSSERLVVLAVLAPAP